MTGLCILGMALGVGLYAVVRLGVELVDALEPLLFRLAGKRSCSDGEASDGGAAR
jgi:hypothetical protein